MTNEEIDRKLAELFEPEPVWTEITELSDGGWWTVKLTDLAKLEFDKAPVSHLSPEVAMRLLKWLLANNPDLTLVTDGRDDGTRVYELVEPDEVEGVFDKVLETVIALATIKVREQEIGFRAGPPRG